MGGNKPDGARRFRLSRMHVILWRFRVRPDREAEFEAAYGDDGMWARFVRSGEGFVGTELMRGTDGTYLTIDRWDSRAAHQAFQAANPRRYAELDTAGLALTIDESLIAEVDT
jgi:heme-degrading monooxygenase HmoA